MGMDCGVIGLYNGHGIDIASPPVKDCKEAKLTHSPAWGDIFKDWIVFSLCFPRSLPSLIHKRIWQPHPDKMVILKHCTAICKITADGDCSHEIKTLAPWKESYDQPRQHIKKERLYSANKGPSSQGYGFSSSHVWMWELDYKESWALKSWCFWTVTLAKTPESPLDCKEIQSVHSKGDQSWIFIGRTDVEAEIPILWPPDAKKWLTWKDPDARKDWRQEEKGTTEDEMAEWHHRLDAHEFE